MQLKVVVGQGAKPGGGGMLLGQKNFRSSCRNAKSPQRGIDQRSACRHPDWTAGDALWK
ncbi:MAG: hypothetical protein CM1200mP30_03600 [Pseudomonadota bacterium]|nr:MAG: hypothetical protein CM1200mP30_03600 [Pseudomonadota bacterium]